jgi:hypothetical protein
MTTFATLTHTEIVGANGTRWHIDAKRFNNDLRVYRVYGDVTKPEELHDALQLAADALGLELSLTA